MVTVEADQVRVESRLTDGQLDCPTCEGVLAPWGWARPRRVRGSAVAPAAAGAVRGCLVTHVLLPVTVLLRRAYAVEVIGAALTARAAGLGHRRIGARLGVRRARSVAGCGGGRAGWNRPGCFSAGGHRAGVDLAVPKALGSPWRDVLAAVGAATAAVTARFGTVGVIGPVTAWQVAAACSAGRLLAPGWPVAVAGAGNTSRP